MIITLIAHERNIGVLTMTDHLVSILGKNNVDVFGWNYLTENYLTIIDKIKERMNEKSIIIKYIIPKAAFSNQGESYPEELDSISDVIFRIPKYIEEISNNTPTTFYKGEENPISEKMKILYK